MRGLSRLVVPAVVLMSPALAYGHGLLGSGRNATTYYYAVPARLAPAGYCVYPIYVLPPCPQAVQSSGPVQTRPPAQSQPAQSSTTYATPRAAPPSSGPATGEPPLATPAPPTPGRGPSVSEPRSYYDAYAVAGNKSGPSFGDRCSIEFWNLSSKDLTLKVDGQTRNLPRGKNLLLETGRQFAWQIEGRETIKENIAAGESALEIVIRR